MIEEEKKENTHQSSDERYLEKLSFRPELRKTWLNFFVTNFRVVLMLIGIITVIGVYAFSKLPRESSPEVKIPYAIVTTVYPGASPTDIEEFVTKKLETNIASITGVKEVTSKSSNSVSSITVEFDAKEDLEDSIRRLRDKVKTAETDLPSDANDPVVTEISLDDTPVWTFSLTGPYDGFEMRSYAEEIQDELEKINGVREVNISGGDEREFEVAYNPDKLVFYGITADQTNAIIKQANIAIPSGNFEGNEFNYSVRTDARIFTEEALQNIPILHTDSGSVVFLKDVADVQEQAIEKTVYSRVSIDGAKPESAITISIVKRTGGSIVDIVKESKKTVDGLLKEFPSGITYATSLDYGELIEEQFDQLVHDFLLTLILVFGILFLIVGLKEAVVAGLAIPLVFFATFGVMLWTDTSLNFLSMFSLILALGLLVDDAIVVVSATKQYLKTGKFTPEEAVLLVLHDFKVVLTTTTLTTVWAFLPLLLSTGIMGSYIRSIPITVSVTLIASLLIALMINHPLAAVLERIRLTRKMFFVSELAILLVAGFFLYAGGWVGYIFGAFLVVVNLWLIGWYEKVGKNALIANEKLSEDEWGDDDLIKKKLRDQGTHVDAKLSEKLMHGILDFHKVLPVYEKYLRKIIESQKNRKRILWIVSLLFISALVFLGTGIVRTEFFPISDQDSISISVEAPMGLNLNKTNDVVSHIEEKLLKYKEIESFSSVVGGSNSSHTAKISIKLVDEEDRNKESYVLSEDIRKDLSSITGATIVVEAPRNGPPSGSPFEAQIQGEDLGTLSKIAHDVEPILASIPGVVDTDISLKEALPEYTFALDSVKMEQNNLTAASVGSTLRMAISGTDVSTVIRNGDEIKIVAQFDKKKIPTLEALGNIVILNTQRKAVFLKDVADIQLNPSVNSITRVDQKRTVTLSSGVAGKTNATEVVAEFQKRLKSEYKMPDGYEISYGGENEQNTESVQSILVAMIVAVFLISATLIIQFNSFQKAFIVLVTLPLALIGVLYGLAMTNIALSFPGLIGVLALFGIVVKNAIILVDKINLNIKTGIPFLESVVDAGKSRLEAIFITSICTIIGIIPITLSDQTWMALGTAVIFGLALSSFLTLFIVPTLYVSLIKEKKRA